MLPRLLLNRVHYGRYMDILITHSPPFGIHDEDTQAHRGLRAINWLIRVAKPRYHLHGHVHFHRRNLTTSKSIFRGTKVINVFPYKILDVATNHNHERRILFRTIPRRFHRALFKSFLNRIWDSLSGQPTLLSYDDIKEKLHIGGPIYRGVQTVRVDQIAGSLNRYHEFDRVFLPASDKLATRWQNVNRAFYQDVSLPRSSSTKWDRSISWWTGITAFRSRASRDRSTLKPKCANAPRVWTSQRISNPRTWRSLKTRCISSSAPPSIH